ncbi:MAG: matrixin family metalloprotease [Candidatus Wallbacteria bacterium]|nr:matrixin family metalloprotease [Candidatus Wallbacteria bacterium]
MANKSRLKKLLYASLLLFATMFLGCKDDGSGTSVPFSLLPYTPQGSDGKANLAVKVRYLRSQTSYNGFWFGVGYHDNGSNHITPIENVLSYVIESTEVTGAESIYWHPKALIRVDNDKLIQNKWAVEDSTLFNTSNYLAGINDLNVGFHKLEMFVPGFKTESIDILLQPGENLLEYQPKVPSVRTPNYYAYISRLIRFDDDAPEKRLRISSRRFLDMPVKVYLGDFVTCKDPIVIPQSIIDSSDKISTISYPDPNSINGGGEFLLTPPETMDVSFQSVDNQTAFINSLEILSPLSIVLDKLHSNARNALNEWATACPALSFVVTDDPAVADLSIYWTNKINVEPTSTSSTSETSTASLLGLTLASNPASNMAGLFLHKPVVLLTAVDPYNGRGLIDNAASEYLALHEIGHALGLWGHSYNEGDVMFGSTLKLPTYSLPRPELSSSDINTINILYEVAPLFTNLPANDYIKADTGMNFWNECIH